jgi:hypothetical protein
MEVAIFDSRNDLLKKMPSFFWRELSQEEGGLEASDANKHLRALIPFLLIQYSRTIHPQLHIPVP